MTLRGAVGLFGVSTAVWLVACGSAPGKGGPAAPAAPASASASTAASAAPAPAGSGAAGSGAGAAGSGAPVKTAADHHREFMGGCAKKALNSPDYCECAWGEFRKAFTDEEMSAGDMPAARLDKVKAQVVGACASKIPEETVKDGFEKGCIGKTPELKSFCECTWTEFRKRFSAAELGDEGTVSSERFTAARAPVVKVCGNKMPESISKDAFMKGCAKAEAAEKFCGCAWKELRKQASPAEIEAGTFDQKTIFGQVEKSCGKLRPPKSTP